MPNSTPLKESFAAGEVSPRVHGQRSSPGYKAGVKTMENCFSDPRGPAVGRPGGEYTVEFTAGDARTESFGVVGDNDTSLVFTDLALDVVDMLSASPSSLYNVATPYTEAQLQDLHVVQAPAGDLVYLFHPLHAPRKLTKSGATYALTIVSFTSTPASWVAGSYPGTGYFFKGRLWMGGTTNDPQTFWGSKAGVPEDLTTGSLADDAIEFTMEAFGAIRWIVGTKNLLIGTEFGEFIVTSVGGVLKTGDIEIEQQSSYGSSTVQPKVIGDQVFYVSPDRTKLRAMQYEWTANNWLSRDLTYFSEHITEGKIRSLAWVQQPNNLLFLAMDSGDAVGLSYERGENTWGWHRHPTNGSFKGFSVLTLSGRSVMIAAAERLTGEIYLERTFYDSDEEYYMDSWKKVTGSGITTVTGLAHLEGFEVQVLTDGVIHPSKTVASGQITLDVAADEIIVGLQYNTKLVLLPFETGGMAGSSKPYTQRFVELLVHILESAKPLVNGNRAATRYPATLMGTMEELMTETVYAAGESWQKDLEVTIEQDLPLPMTITHISGKLAQEIT